MNELEYLQQIAYEFLLSYAGHYKIDEIKTLLDDIGKVSIGRNLETETAILDEWKRQNDFVTEWMAGAKISTMEFKPINFK